MFSVAIEFGKSGALKHYAALPVSPALRGYAEESQLRLPPDAAPKKMVSITALAVGFCPTGRDLYLEKHRKIHIASWQRDVLGRVVDKVLVELHRSGLEVLENAFENVSSTGALDLAAVAVAIRDKGQLIATEVLGNWEFSNRKSPYNEMTLEQFAEAMQPGNGTGLIDGTTRALFALVDYEIELLFSYIESCRGPLIVRWASQAYVMGFHLIQALRRRIASGVARANAGGEGTLRRSWMAKVRATLARLQTGIQLDLRKAVSASTFGVNEKICPDFLYAVTLVGDLKTGPNPEFYDGVATGYAIFAEYALERRINTAAILSIDLDVTAGIVRSHTIRIIHPDDDLRMHWVTQRDTALRIFAMPNEPQHPEDTLICNDCTFRSICWVDGVVGGTPILDGQPVAPLPGA